MSFQDQYVGLNQSALDFINTLKKSKDFIREEYVEVCEDSEHSQIMGTKILLKTKNPEKYIEEYYVEILQAVPKSSVNMYFTCLRHVGVKPIPSGKSRPELENLGELYQWEEDKKFNTEYDLSVGKFNVY